MEKIILNDTEITYIIKKNTKKNIRFSVNGTGVLQIGVPKWFPKSRYKEVITENKSLILNLVKKYEERDNGNRILLNDNENIFIFGKFYKIKVNIIDSDFNYIKIKDFDSEIIFDVCRSCDFEIKKELLFKAISKASSSFFDSYNTETYNLLKSKNYNVLQADLKFRKMKNLQGKCDITNEIITINKLLVFASEEIIKYIFIHEYCHFIHQNHSRAFYDLQSEFCENYKELDNELRGVLRVLNMSGIL